MPDFKKALVKKKIRDHFDSVPYYSFREDSQEGGCWLYSKWFPIKKPETIDIMKEMPELEIRGNEVRKQRYLPQASAENIPEWKKDKL